MHSRRTDASPFAAHILTIAAAVALVSAGAPQALAQEGLPAIAPHRAVYDLEMESSEDRLGLADASGRLALEFAAADCEGWTVNMRIVNRLRTRNGTSRTIDSRSSSWESADGTSMAFTLRRYVENTVDEETKGVAERGGDGKPGHVAMEKPAEDAFDIPAGAVFPVEHTKRILKAALDGARREVSLVYDGSEEKTVYKAITFIGERRAPGETRLPAGLGEELKSMASWPVSISYFDETKTADGEETPSHQVSFTMFENAVASNLTLDYGDFSLSGTLSTLELLDAPECPAE